MDKTKKTVNLSMAAIVAISYTGTSYLNAGVLDSAMSNVTKPKVLEEYDSNGNLISYNFYSGGVSYSFNNGDYPQPLWSASPPRAEVGCNGLNIKGMFVSLIGLDQLGNMLQNAGASLAWGVAVGLIYSLPGIAGAFKMINQWAKEIQKILGNMCQSGIILGQQMYDNSGVIKENLEKWANWANDAIPTCQQEGESCIGQLLGMSPVGGTWFQNNVNIDSNGVFSFGGGTVTEASTKEKKTGISKFLRGIVLADPSMSSKLINSFIEKDTTGHLAGLLFPDGKATELSSNKVFETSLFAIVPGTGTHTTADGVKVIGMDDFVNQLPSQTDKTKAKIALWSMIILYNYVGDGVISGMYKRLTNALNDLANGGDSSQALSDFEDLKNDPIRVDITGPGVSFLGDAAGEKLAKFIYNGTSVETTATGGSAELLRDIYSIKEVPLFLAVKTEETNSADAIFTIVTVSPKDTGVNPVAMPDADYTGTRLGSECQIRSMLGDPLPAKCATAVNTPVLFEGIDRFIKIVKNSPSREKSELVDALVNYNSVMAGYALLNAMQTALTESDSVLNRYKKVDSTGGFKRANESIPVPEKDAALKAYEWRKVSAQKMVKSAKKEFEKLSGGVDTYKNVKGIFERQELLNRERGTRATIK